MIWRLWLIVIVVGAFLAFALANQQTEVTLAVGPGLHVGPMPVFLLVLGVFGAGILVSLLITFPGWLRMRITIKRQRKTIQTMEEELNRITTPLSRNKDP